MTTRCRKDAALSKLCRWGHHDEDVHGAERRWEEVGGRILFFSFFSPLFLGGRFDILFSEGGVQKEA